VNDTGIGRKIAFATNLGMAVLFLFSAAVQYNDPDPLRWMAIYLVATLACAQHARRRLSWPLPTVVALVASSWAATLAPVATPSAMFQHDMSTPGVEEAREMFGLLLVAAWTAVLAALGRDDQAPNSSI
jgi:hypothetical protein